jgi:hypothetical protein
LATHERARCLALQGKPELVGIALLPRDVPLLAIDAEPQAHLLAGRHRRNPHGPACAIVVSQQNVRVILEAPTWDHGLQVCGQRRHALAGDEFAKVEAMGAKIADDKGGAGLRRIGAPEPAFIEPMQCKAVTALPAGEKWTFEIKS